MLELPTDQVQGTVQGQVRDMSTMIRAQHGVNKIRPFDLKNCADLGDVAPNPASLEDTLKRFENYFQKLSI